MEAWVRNRAVGDHVEPTVDVFLHSLLCAVITLLMVGGGLAMARIEEVDVREDDAERETD